MLRVARGIKNDNFEINVEGFLGVETDKEGERITELPG
jgi:hypothetical protein